MIKVLDSGPIYPSRKSLLVIKYWMEDTSIQELKKYMVLINMKLLKNDSIPITLNIMVTLGLSG